MKYFLSLFLGVFVLQLSAQGLILKEPQFPEPEKNVLYFLQEDFVFDTNAYNGQITKIDRVYTEYDSAGNSLGKNTNINQPIKKVVTHKKISKEPILDYLGVKTIKKVKRKTFELEILDTLNYEPLFYTLKNGLITKKANGFDGDVLYVYNDKNQLIKKVIDNEYGGENIELATYNSKGQILTYKSFDTRDGLSVYEKQYHYNNLGLLEKVKEEEAYYSIPWAEIEEKTKKPIEITQLDYKAYIEDDRQINEKTIDFIYDSNNMLIEANQNYNIYSKDGSAYYDPSDYDNYKYKISYEPNKLFVAASLPSKRLYEYTFDEKKNPINIKSYVVSNTGKWLHKETVLTISYE
jgi:hypothetical protein